MPRVNKSIAATDRYIHGKLVDSDKTKNGKRLDKSQPRDENDKLFCKKGDTYYWWQFKNQPKQFSLTYPKPKQLTQSAFLQQVYDFNERLENCKESISSHSDVEEFVSTIKDEIELLKDETQSSLDNMPEHLQESSVLNERIENLESVIDELDGIETNYDEPDEDEIREEVKTDEGWDDDLDDDDDDQPLTKEQLDTRVQEKIAEAEEEWINERCDEISNISIQC